MYQPFVEKGYLPAPIQYFPAGKEVVGLKPYDIGFTRQSISFMGRNIAWFSRGYWSHTFVTCWYDEFISEALERGVEWDRATKYKDHDVMVIKLSETLSAIAKATLYNYYNAVVDRPWGSRERYGYKHIVSLALFLTGQGFRENILGLSPRTGRAPLFGEPDQIICSGYAAEGLERLGYAHPRIPARWVWPVELAKDLGGITDERILKDNGLIKG